MCSQTNGQSHRTARSTVMLVSLRNTISSVTIWGCNDRLVQRSGELTKRVSFMPPSVQTFRLQKKTGASDYSDAPCLYYARVSHPESEPLQQWRDGVRADESAAAG